MMIVKSAESPWLRKSSNPRVFERRLNLMYLKPNGGFSNVRSD